MKALENIDLDKDNELYNNIFAEGSSEDDDFEVSKSNSLIHDSFDSDFYKEESISCFEEGSEEDNKKNKNKNSNTKKNKNKKNKFEEDDEKSEEKETKRKKLGKKINQQKKNGDKNLNFLLKDPDVLDEIKLIGSKRNRKKIEEVELMDLEMLDIDKIDEMENMDNEEFESEESENKNISENSEEFIPNLIGKSQEEENNRDDQKVLDAAGENIDSRKFKIKNENFLEEKNNFPENKFSENNNLNEEEIEEQEPESEYISDQSEKKNKFKIKIQKNKEKKIKYRKNFIDYEEDDEFLKQKKKFKDNLNRNIKQTTKKKKIIEKTEKTENFISEKNILQIPEEEIITPAKINNIDDISYNNIIKFENNQINSSVGKPIKNLNFSDKKISLRNSSSKPKIDEKIFISDFNVIIKKSYLDLENAKIFNFSENENILFSDVNKIILKKSVLFDQGNLLLPEIKNSKRSNSNNKNSILNESKIKLTHDQGNLSKNEEKQEKKFNRKEKQIKSIIFYLFFNIRSSFYYA